MNPPFPMAEGVWRPCVVCGKYSRFLLKVPYGMYEWVPLSQLKNKVHVMDKIKESPDKQNE